MPNSALGRWLMYAVHGRSATSGPPPASSPIAPARNWKYRAWVRSLPSGRQRRFALRGRAHWQRWRHVAEVLRLFLHSTDLARASGVPPPRPAQFRAAITR